MRTVLVLVDIPTHVRVMAQAADLLRASGRYDPVMVYGTLVIRDQCKDNPSIAGLRSWAWDGTSYRLDQASAEPATESPSPVASDAEPVAVNAGPAPAETGGEAAAVEEPHIYLAGRIWKWPKKIYKSARRAMPALPSPHSIVLAGLAVQRAVRSVAWRCLNAWATVSWTIRAAGITMATLARIIFSASGEKGVKSRLRSRLRSLVLEQFRSDWQPGARSSRALALRGLSGKLPMQVRALSLQHAAIEAVLEREAPDLLLLPEENLFYAHLLWVQAARARGAATCVIPFTIVNTLEWAEAFWPERAFSAKKPGNWPYAFAFPRWVLSHRGRQLLLPPAHVLFAEFFGVTPDQPWLINSGPTDAVAVESGFMDHYYRRAGIRPGKLHLTGALSDDLLYTRLQHRTGLRRALLQELGLSGSRIVLVALPPDQFHGAPRAGCEFKSHADLVRAMVAAAVAACQPGDVVLVNLHPRVDASRVGFVETELGARIVHAPIEELVPLADLYVAVVSATIRLAIACGIPVVNYDAYVYNYDDYKGLAGVLEVRTEADYKQSLRALLQEPIAYERTRLAQAATAAERHILDGRAGARLLQLFDKLCEPRSDCARQAGKALDRRELEGTDIAVG